MWCIWCKFWTIISILFKKNPYKVVPWGKNGIPKKAMQMCTAVQLLSNLSHYATVHASKKSPNMKWSTSERLGNQAKCQFYWANQKKVLEFANFPCLIYRGWGGMANWVGDWPLLLLRPQWVKITVSVTVEILFLALKYCFCGWPFWNALTSRP